MAPSKFGVNWPSVQEMKRKIDFQDGGHGGHLGFPIGTILAIFDLQVTLMLPTKFQVNWPFSSGEEAKNRFSRWLPWRPSWISGWHNFSFFLIYKSRKCRDHFLARFRDILAFFCKKLHQNSGSEKKNRTLNFSHFAPSLESIGLSVQEKKRKIDFQDGGHSGHLGFPIGTILAIFDLQVTLMLPTKYQVNWPRGTGGVGF